MKKRKKFLVFGSPFVGKEEIAELVDTIKSGWWGTGSKTHLFEEKFRKYIGCKYSLALNSCTAGMHLGLDVLGIGKGDEVITTPLTFTSTVNVIIHRQAKPVFTDVEFDSWNIDPAEIEKKITKKTKAILPVHLYGRPCKMDKIMALAKKCKLFVLEDAAHAVETWYKGEKIGNIGDITAFSFYVTKNIATGEGGMVTTNNKHWIEEMRIKSLHGISKDAWKRYSAEGYQPYETLYPGYKYNMMDIQASLGLYQLARVKKNAKIRKKYWEMYDKAFRSVAEIITPLPDDPETYHARHLYAILIRPEMLTIGRDQFINELKELNIGGGVHFTPVHLHYYYRKTFGFKKGDFPNAEFVGERTISLPLGANLTEKDINYVIQAVKWIITKYRK